MLVTLVSRMFLSNVFYPRRSHLFFFIPLLCIGNTHDAMKLLEKGADILYADPRDGWSAAHYAARYGMVKVLNAMLKGGMDVNMRTTGKETLLHKACRTNRTGTITWLMKVTV